MFGAAVILTGRGKEKELEVGWGRLGGGWGSHDGFPSPVGPGSRSLNSLACMCHSQRAALRPSSRSAALTDGTPGGVKGKERERDRAAKEANTG